MARKLFRSLAQKGRESLGSGYLGRLSGFCLHHPRLWYLNRHNVAWAVSVGLFVAFIPVPFQMLLAAIIALCIGCNLPVAVVTVWVSNPVTIAPMFYAAYRLGTWLLGEAASHPVTTVAHQSSMHAVVQQMHDAWKPFILGCLISGLLLAVTGHVMVRLLWRLQVVKAWQQRRQLRLARREFNTAPGKPPL